MEKERVKMEQRPNFIGGVPASIASPKRTPPGSPQVAQQEHTLEDTFWGEWFDWVLVAAGIALGLLFGYLLFGGQVAEIAEEAMENM